MKKRESQPTFMEKVENRVESMKYEIGEEMNFNKKGQAEKKKEK